MRRIASFAVVAALVIFGTSASAEQPMELTDDQMDHVTAGGFGFVDVELIVTKFKDVFENVHKRVDKNVNVNVNVDGFLADAEAGANCFASNCVAETLTITDARADLFTATAFSESLSAGDPFNFYFGHGGKP